MGEGIALGSIQPHLAKEVQEFYMVQELTFCKINILDSNRIQSVRAERKKRIGRKRHQLAAGE